MIATATTTATTTATMIATATTTATTTATMIATATTTATMIATATTTATMHTLYPSTCKYLCDSDVVKRNKLYLPNNNYFLSRERIRNSKHFKRY